MKKMFYKFQKCNNDKNWRAYAIQRNYVTNVKRQSLNTYFIERCEGRPKSRDFWPTMKPFLTNKGNTTTRNTILCENDTLVNSQGDVCDIFNSYFVNVAKNIGTMYKWTINIQVSDKLTPLWKITTF
jgi:hypothetical protein